jgi:hypothetical protein
MPTLVALAGKSRVGKGTCASVFAELAQAQGFSSFERQLSDNGKWHLARIFFPEISRVDAVAWFEELKSAPNVQIELVSYALPDYNHMDRVDITRQPLQKFIQHGLQEGGRDIFGADLWTDMILPTRLMVPTAPLSEISFGDQQPHRIFWEEGFFDKESGHHPDVLTPPKEWRFPDLAIISDMRQVSEAERVRECGGVVIELHRADVDDGYITGAQHITERGLPSHLVDFHLNNYGNLETWRGECAAFFEKSILPRLRGEIA